MATVNNITLYVAPPDTAEIGSAYLRLVLGLAQYVPGLINTYFGPPEWQAAVQAEPPLLETLRQHAIAVATAVQKSDLPRHRRERILRNVRALLWLIRAQEGEQIMFSEQVRLLLDLQPESAAEEVFQAAQETLAANLPGSGPLAERWADWQASYTIPATVGLPLLAETLNTLRERLSVNNTLTAGAVHVVETEATGPLAYRPGQLFVPRAATFRADRLYHLAARWGYGGLHSFYTALVERYAAGQGEVECAVLLNLGPDQVIAQGLPLTLLPGLDLYAEAIPSLLDQAGLPVVTAEQLQAIHLAEEALQWASANAALLLHSERLRSRAVRRYLMTQALLSQESAETLLDDLVNPIYAAHVFAPLIGGPLLQAWLVQANCSPAELLADPPVPATIVFELRFAEDKNS